MLRLQELTRNQANAVIFGGFLKKLKNYHRFSAFLAQDMCHVMS